MKPPADQIAEQEQPAHLPLIKYAKRWQIVLAIVVIALLARSWAAWQLPMDADEPTYLRAGQEYASMIRAGDFKGILSYEYNREHPALVKLMYSLPYLIIEPRFGQTLEFNINRLISVAWGVLAVLVLSLIDPLAGFLLALDSMVIKYTSEVYLESFPLFAGLLAVFAFRKFALQKSSQRWFWISAVSLGAAAAGKYLYILLGVAVLTLFWQGGVRSWRRLGLYGLVVAISFLALNPALWLDPLGNLWQSLTFHWRYSQSSADILRASYPWYQPLNWITAMVPWHPQVFFIPTPDALIFWLALAGGIHEWRKGQVWMIVWAAAVFFVLLVWPTKWPQYTLMLIPALCLLSASGFRWLWGLAVGFADEWNLVEGVLPHPGRIFWIALALFLIGMVSLKVSYEIRMYQGRVGWSTLVRGISPLPTDSVHAIVATKDGRIIIATNDGVAIWRPTEKSPWGEDPIIFTQLNTPLPTNRVVAIAEDLAGGFWFGTDSGLCYWDGSDGWKTFRGSELNVGDDQILSLLVDSNGQVWAGTKKGAAVYDGRIWKAIPEMQNLAVFSLAEQRSGDFRSLWFGTLQGASQLNLSNSQWQSFDLSKYGLSWAGVSSLLADRQGRLWAATLGDGVSVWNGNEWITYRSSNSNIPTNSAVRLLMTESGLLWAGFSYSTEPGGILAQFDGNGWKIFSQSNSGYEGGEPTALALDSMGRLWVGTALNGVQIYQFGEGKND